MPYKTLPDITGKQQIIIDLVYKFRFINRKQIQEIMGHKDARRINSWLKDLVEKNYLGRIYSHKLLENTKPAVYYLNNSGILWCKINMGWKYRGDDDELPTSEIKKFYEDKHASETFRNHCLTLCDICLQFKRLEINSPWVYEYLTKTELWTMKKEDEDFQEKKNYIPDAYIEKFKKTESDSIIFLLELFDLHVPRYTLEYKVNQYIKLREEGDWSDYGSINERFPTIIFIFPTQQKLNRLATFIQERLDWSYVKDVEFILTTYEKVMKEGFKNKTIWKIISYR